MKTLLVTVRFARGLHARPAASLVKLFKAFRAHVHLRSGARIANAASFLSILLLAAAVNTQIEIQAAGEDADLAIAAAQNFFACEDEDDAQRLAPPIRKFEEPI